ncbi:unnamed protein product, partial [Mesorhabditis belari]|uniref:Uncharacterized protein n=1 Tax=Mesorhabditis belari TaxID=2138241 RepID=A0AAF3FTD6_9BILA
MTSDPIVLLTTSMEEKGNKDMYNNDEVAVMKLALLEEQLSSVREKMPLLEAVIVQLSEELRVKEELINEQKHLIEVLEAMHNNEKNAKNEKDETESTKSEAEVTVIENLVEAGASKPEKETEQPPQCIYDEVARLRIGLSRAMVDREKLELQNEQLLRQWEEALEYVSTVQRQLHEEMQRCCGLQEQLIDTRKRHQDLVCVSRDFVQFLGVFAAVLAVWLYML